MIGYKMQRRVIIVSNRLPVHITRDGSGLTINRSIGGLATGLSAVGKKHPALWVGWAGNRQPFSKREHATLSLPPSIAPVAIPARLLHRYYDRFANGVLWPTLHAMQPHARDDQADWEALQAVTARFAQTVATNCQPHDLIWVHDFHLMLLPQALREMGVHNPIGFFLHTPFPPAAIFMNITEHRALLAGIAAANLRGFQTTRDMRRFQACARAARIPMPAGTRSKVFPIGIDFDEYANAGKLASVHEYLGQLSPSVQGQRVVLSVSRLDYTKGIIEQLQGFARAVDQHDLRHIRYHLIVAPSREARHEYRTLQRTVEKNVAAINATFHEKKQTAHVSYAYRNHGFEELNAWYRLADVLLVTPYIDGMNLVAKEYIAARAQPGTLVLSRLAGAAEQLRDALLVTPHSVQSIANGLYAALTMPAPEKQHRWNQLQANVRTQNVFWWSDAFIACLKHDT